MGQPFVKFLWLDIYSIPVNPVTPDQIEGDRVDGKFMHQIAGNVCTAVSYKGYFVQKANLSLAWQKVLCFAGTPGP